MPRFTGDFQGKCEACDEYVEFAVGIQTDRTPVAMHFGPSGPQPVRLIDVELGILLEDTAEIRIRFECPLCGGDSSGKLTCRHVPDPLSAS
ncbi:MAG: hypothetical protein DCC65_02815 [Planctomycetota bacterium]|nr:MAG: hypothetical protein DCC65_02815 [Planctomycetota bacterium]